MDKSILPPQTSSNQFNSTEIHVIEIFYISALLDRNTRIPRINHDYWFLMRCHFISGGELNASPVSLWLHSNPLNCCLHEWFLISFCKTVSDEIASLLKHLIYSGNRVFVCAKIVQVGRRTTQIPRFRFVAQRHFGIILGQLKIFCRSRCLDCESQLAWPQLFPPTQAIIAVILQQPSQDQISEYFDLDKKRNSWTYFCELFLPFIESSFGVDFELCCTWLLRSQFNYNLARFVAFEMSTLPLVSLPIFIVIFSFTAKHYKIYFLAFEYMVGLALHHSTSRQWSVSSHRWFHLESVRSIFGISINSLSFFLLYSENPVNPDAYSACNWIKPK